MIAAEVKPSTKAGELVEHHWRRTIEQPRYHNRLAPSWLSNGV